MTAPRIVPPRSRNPDGHRLGAALDGHAVVVVLGESPSDTAQLALSIARAQARRRRVVLIDLIGDLSVLQALLPAGAVHGLMDGIEHGVSLGKIAYPVDVARNLYLLPSGAGPIEHAVLLGSRRWRQLLRTLREAHALVLLVAPAELPQRDELLPQTDGAVVLGDAILADDPHVITRVSTGAPSESAPVVMPRVPAGTRAEHRGRVEEQRSPRWIKWLVLAILVVVVVAILYRFTRPKLAIPLDRPAAAAGQIAGAIAAPSQPSAHPAPSVPATPAIPVANAADSSRAVSYGVVLETVNTAAAAMRRLERGLSRYLPAITFSHLSLGADSSQWYRVYAGAYASPSSADSLLAALHGRRVLAPEAGRVAHVPFAIRMRTAVPLSDAHALATAYRARGIPVYALHQDDGSLTLYAGAYESPAQAAPVLASLRENGEDSVAIVYRTGSVH
ncbi:MAG TPA: hypothetical protein VFW98_02450 [Gemmatimonadaceae bacterium]|nr:hypothetical protein [Gemmatimonadaceae bacterium]